MSKRNDQLLFLDILDSINRIENYIKDLDYKTFLTDHKTKDAVVRNLEIIGEASKHISKRNKDKLDVPWKRVSGLRNRIVHEYFGVDYKIVWRIITEQLNDLKTAIENLDINK